MPLSLSLRPLTSGFGAVVDCDLNQAQAQAPSPALAAALHHHRLLIFPRQHLNHADLLAASAHFGTVDTHVDHRYAVGGFPGITTVSNIIENSTPIGIHDGNNGEGWHADNTFTPRRSRATLLYSVITPNHGAQTRITDTTQAYADLPGRLKERIHGLRAVHSIQPTQQTQASGGHSSSAAAGSRATTPTLEQPLVQTHPVTGAHCLLLDPMAIKEITGLAEEESGSLLANLLQRATSPRYVYTHRWSQGDLLVWDNLATLHTASPCGSPRHHQLLYRTSVRY